MFRTICFVIFILLSVLSYSQQRVRDLNAVITGGGVIKFYDENYNEVSKPDGEKLVYSNQEATKYYKIGKKQNITSNVLGGTAVGFTVALLGGFAGAKDKTVYFYLLAPYAATITVALIKMNKAKKNVQRSMDLYNDALLGNVPKDTWNSSVVNINIAATGNGLGLHFSF